MRMIGCVSPPTGGTLRILGMDPLHAGPTIRGRLGVVPQLDTLDNELTVRENLIIYARYFGISRKDARVRADELLEFVQLSERAKDKVEPLSGGMKRRLTIARSLVNDPEVLLLDEPTTGLDPQARHVVWERLFRLKQQGVTLVLTTHYMDEAEQLCDRLVIMDRGRIAEEGSPVDLIKAPLHARSGRDPLSGGSAAARCERVQRSGRTRRVGGGPDLALHRRRRRCRSGRARAAPSAERARATQLARGRLSLTHRSHADRLMAYAFRVYEWWVLGYRRTWRGSVVSSVLNPVLYLTALGIGLGKLVNRGNALGIPYIEFVAPGMLAVVSMQIGAFEASYPVMAAIRWTRQYHAILATPLRIRDIVLGHQMYVASRVGAAAGVYLVALVAFDAIRSPWAVLAWPVAILLGLSFSAPVSAFAALARE